MCDHSPNREAAMVTIRRDETGKPTVWCDPCMVPLVRALNDGGLPTIASCCGHGRAPSSVILADDRFVFVVGRETADHIFGRDLIKRAKPAKAASPTSR